MASTSPGYGITIRVDAPASAQPVSEITQAILAAGASITALDVVESVLDRVVIDVTCDAIDAEHAEAITAALSENKNLNVRKVSDRTFLLHLGGKIEIASKVPLKTRDDLSRAYTPGVARICQAIAKDPSDLRRLTIKRNTVAVVTDGSAVLGLGHIGPGAALPLKLVKKDLKSTKIVLSGVGAAGTAVARLLIANGAKNIIGFGRDGLIFEDKGEDDPMRKWFVENCSPGAFRGDLSAAMKGADVFIGLSAPNVLVEADIKSMAKDAIVFALANPDPEIDPALARKHAAVVATGRSDHPNQINNVLAFPGIFRGLLDAHITKITDNMLVLAAEAIASCVSSEQLNANFIVPSVFDPTVSQKVAAAVKKSV